MQFELWHLITLATTLVGAYAGLLKLLLSQHSRNMEAAFLVTNERLTKIEKVNETEANNWQRIERELMRLQVDLPQSYVRRDDYIRGQSVIEAKLDGLATRIENVQLRSIVSGEKK